MKVFSPLVFVLMGILCSNLALAAAKVYKWTDDKGITHYSEHPPLNIKTTLIKPQIALGEFTEESSASSATSSIASSTKAQNAAAAQALAEAKAAAKRDPERCDSAKENITALKTYSHVKVKDGDDYRYLTPEEQQQKLQEFTKAATESCEPGTFEADPVE